MDAEKIPTEIEGNNEELTLEEKIQIYEETLQKGNLPEDADLKQIPTLTREEEIEFAKKIEEGEKIYENYLLIANLRFLAMKATKVVSDRGSFEREDIIQEGIIGLMKGIKKFEHDKGYKFLTYAEWWIKQNTNRAKEQKADIIRLPSSIKQKILNYKKHHEALYGELQREPTLEEIAEKMEIATEKVKDLQNLSKRCVISIDKPIKDEDGELYWDNQIQDTTFGIPEEIVLKKTYQRVVRDLVENLDEREKDIIKALFAFNEDNPESLKKIGKKFGLTKQRISIIKQNILEKLKVSLIQDEDKMMEEILGNYTDIEKKVIELRFGLNDKKAKSRTRTKALLELSESQIEKIENKCIKEIFSYYIENL